MPKKRSSSERIIAKLRQIEVQLAQGKSVALACKDAAISEQSSGTEVRLRVEQHAPGGSSRLQPPTSRNAGPCLRQSGP